MAHCACRYIDKENVLEIKKDIFESISVICGIFVGVELSVAVTNWPETLDQWTTHYLRLSQYFLYCIFQYLCVELCMNLREEIMICLAPVRKVPMSLFALYSALLIIQWNL